MDLVSYILGYFGRTPNADNSPRALAKYWLTLSIETYQRHHALPLESNFAPTRLLDLSPGAPLILPEKKKPKDKREVPEAGSSKIKLLCVKPGFREPYATLSHKWGNLQSFRTTKDTLATHQEGMKFKQLPKTFQDAVRVTRALGIRYIWIDAICVVQDDPDDWNNEASLMAKVYGSAFLNIAAHSAEDDQTGFLRKDFVDQASNFRWRHIPQKFSVNGFGVLIDESALSHRSWVLQERLLSPRILHFVDKYMFWEDDYSVRAEDRTHTDCVGIRTLWKRQGLSSDWYALMQMYTSLDITFESDRLPAIAGLVAELEVPGSNDYCAGVWSTSLHQGLLWRPKDNPNCDSKADQGNSTPSWSWAYCQSPVQFPADMNRLAQTAEFIGFHSRRASLVYNWQCSEAILTLNAARTSLSECLLRRKNLKASSSTKGGRAWNVYYSEVGKYTKYVGEIIMDQPCTKLDPRSLVCVFIAKSTSKCDALFGCRLCRKLKQTYDSHRDFVVDHMYGLVLQKSHTTESRLRRLGLGKFCRSPWTERAEREVVMIE